MVISESGGRNNSPAFKRSLSASRFEEAYKPRDEGSRNGKHDSDDKKAVGLVAPMNSFKPVKTVGKARVPGLNKRTWAKLDTTGDQSFVQLDKFKLTQELGVQLRDLRTVDPNLASTYSSSILIRERALVVSLEYIRVIITTQGVWINNYEDEAVVGFIEQLKSRLRQPSLSALNLMVPVDAPRSNSLTRRHIDLPFELRVMEVCLEQIASLLDNLTSELVAKSHHALDKLTSRVTAANLEQVRRMKSRLVRLTTKVETIRELLEKLLADDKDMRAMNLSAKEAAELRSNLSRQERLERRASQVIQSLTRQNGTGTQYQMPQVSHHLPPRQPANYLHSPTSPVALGRHSVPNSYQLPMSPVPESSFQSCQEQGLRSTPLSPHQVPGLIPPASSSSSSSSSHDTSDSLVEEEIAEVEMLLEAYFMQVDNVWNRLQTLKEYIDDTEDLINIELDQHRNQLISVDLLLTAGTTCLAMMSAIGAIFGMNLNNTLEEDQSAWFQVVGGTAGSAACIFLMVTTACWYFRIITF